MNILTLENFEQCVLKAMLPVDIEAIIDGASLRVGTSLLPPVNDSESVSRMIGVDGCKGSNRMTIGGLGVETGDIMFCSDAVGGISVFKVLGCVEVPEILPPHAIGQRYEKEGESTWRLQHGEAAVAISHEHILAVAVWAPTNDPGVICVLVPPALAYYHTDDV